MYFETPSDHKELHAQKVQSSVTDDEFDSLFAVPQPNLFAKVVQFLTYAVFFGLFRCILTFVSLFIYYLFTVFLPYFKNLYKNEREFKISAHKICRPSMRAFLFFAGIVKMNIKGRIDPEARVFVSNHLTMVDIVNILYCVPYSVVAHAGLKGNSFFEHTAQVFDVVYVDRSAKQNATQSITDAANDPLKLPMLVFPEGKVTNGEAVLAFRTGAFVSGQPVQPISLRYRSWFGMKQQQTPAWLHFNIFMYGYQFWAIPFMTVDIHFLPLIKSKGGTTPQERAITAQLAIANDLGTKAIDRTNKSIFAQKAKTE